MLTGYVFETAAEAWQSALRLDGPEVAAVSHHCRQRRVHAVVGLLERDGETLSNTALLIDAHGNAVGSYRKAHLPLLGVDRFVDAGCSARAPVFETAIGRLGLNICYDIRFPESARLLALAGADIVAQPVNWPVEARMLPEHFARVRACENRVVLAVANRGDEERGTTFVGLSQIALPDGTVAAMADERGETVLVEEVDLAEARRKRVVRDPGRYETDVLADRRPELYSALTHVKEGEYIEP
jgi:predicted amidohydrolase